MGAQWEIGLDCLVVGVHLVELQDCELDLSADGLTMLDRAQKNQKNA